MKKNKTLIKELRKELHYHQQMLRVDVACLKLGIAKVKEIAKEMRRLQREIRFAPRYFNYKGEQVEPDEEEIVGAEDIR